LIRIGRRPISRISKAAFTAGFVILAERSMNAGLDCRKERRAAAIAAKTGFGTEALWSPSLFSSISPIGRSRI